MPQFARQQKPVLQRATVGDDDHPPITQFNSSYVHPHGPMLNHTHQ